MKAVDLDLDNAWSELVKLRAGKKCEVCGKPDSLNSHHIYSRSKRSVRWDVMNGICLCVGHHIGNKFSAHKTPNDFTYWLEKKRGQHFMDLLSAKAHRQSKLMDFEKELLLKELKAEIKKIKDGL